MVTTTHECFGSSRVPNFALTTNVTMCVVLECGMPRKISTLVAMFSIGGLYLEEGGIVCGIASSAFDLTTWVGKSSWWDPPPPD